MRPSIRIALLCIVSLIPVFGLAESVFAVSAPFQESIGIADGDAGSEVLLVPNSSTADSPRSNPKPVLHNRLLMTAALVIVLLGQLSVLFGYLKINHATRGFYSGRLQSFSVVASAAVFAVGYLFFMAWKI